MKIQPILPHSRLENATFMSLNAFLNSYIREHKNWHEATHYRTGENYVCIDLSGNAQLWVAIFARSESRYSFSTKAILYQTEGCGYSVDVETIFNCLIINSKKTFTTRCKNSYAAHEVVPPRLEKPAEDWSFIDAEQALLMGHPHHPHPRSRDEMTFREAQLYAPEHQGRFALYWIYVAPRYVAGDGLDCARKLALNAGIDERQGFIALPFHPWQAKLVLQDPKIRALETAGACIPIGGHEKTWAATSSMRCLYSANAPYMIKTSLSLRLTNSLRVLSAHEIERGVQMRQLFQSPLGQIIRRNAPTLNLLQERGWTGLNVDGHLLPSSFALYRDNPFRGMDKGPVMMASLCEDIFGQLSPLGAMIARVAKQNNTSLRETAKLWFERYLDIAISPLLYLRAHHGILIGAHQQNMMIGLKHGLPDQVWIRDGQGGGQLSHFKNHLSKYMPDIGIRADNTVEASVGDRLLCYYVIVNNVFNTAATLVLDGYGPDASFMKILRHFLIKERKKGGDIQFIDMLLTRPTLPVKGNFRTSLCNINETDGGSSRQAAYFLTIPNPLFTTRASEVL